MVNAFYRSWWVVGSWSAVVVAMLLTSVALRANASTTVLVVALAVTPVIVAMFLGDDASPAASVAQILHPPQTRDGRS